MYKHLLKYFGIDPTFLLACAINFSVDVPSHSLFTNTISGSSFSDSLGCLSLPPLKYWEHGLGSPLQCGDAAGLRKVSGDFIMISRCYSTRILSGVSQGLCDE